MIDYSEYSKQPIIPKHELKDESFESLIVEKSNYRRQILLDENRTTMITKYIMDAIDDLGGMSEMCFRA